MYFTFKSILVTQIRKYAYLARSYQHQLSQAR